MIGGLCISNRGTVGVDFNPRFFSLLPNQIKAFVKEDESVVKLLINTLYSA
jgi:hypothetical protein